MAYGLITPLLVVGTSQMIAAKPADTRITIHPEGGHLIPGGLNRVIILAQGVPPESASLHGEAGRIMQVEFEEGLASVHFLPMTGQRYHLEYVVQGSVQRMEFPPVEPKAMTMRVHPGPRKTQVIDVSSGPKAPRAGTLFLTAGRKVLHSQEVRLNDEGKASILVAEGFFPEGFSELFLLDEEIQLLSYRPVYVPASPKAIVSIGELPEAAGLRTDVEVSLTVTDEAGLPLRSSLTVSVIPEATRLTPIRTPDPSLELRHIQPPFDWTGPTTRIEKDVIARSPIPTRLVPDYPVLLHSGSLSLSGKAYSTDPTAVLPYLSRMVIYLHNDLIQYEAPIDGNGNFHFEKIYDFLGADKVFYKVINKEKQVSRVRVDWSANLGEEIPFSLGKLQPIDAEDAYGMIRSRKQTIDHSFSYFLAPDSMAVGVRNFNAVLEDKFQGADFTV